MKIGKKLTLTIFTVVLSGIGILISVVLLSVRKEITERVHSEINNLAKQEASQNQAWFQVFMDATRTISDIMEKAGIKPLTRCISRRQSRRTAIILLRLTGV